MKLKKEKTHISINRFNYFHNMNGILFGVMIAIVLFGIMAIYSSSIYTAYYNGESQTRYIVMQMIGLLVGLGAHVFLICVPYKKYLSKPMIILALMFSIVTLVIVLFTEARLGASRWINLGPVDFQPSELGKIIYVLFLAYWFVKYEKSCYYDGKLLFSASIHPKARRRIQKDRGFWRRILMSWGVPLGVSLLMIILLYLEPDNGSIIIMLLVFLVLSVAMFVRSKKVRTLIAVALILGCAVLFMKDVIAEPVIKFVGEDSHIAVRFRAWLDPFADYEGDGYQLANSYIAIAKGGVTGVGLGKGSQKQGFLPEGHTDFILANIAEEFGLFGIGLVLIGFYIIISQSFKIAMRSEDKQAKLTILGLMTLFLVQIFWNAAGISGLLPMKGLTAPLLSYGGTSILFMVILLGIVQGIAVRTNKQEKAKIGEVSR
ncbi:MAG: FtsW/RodA/SpoVE family cell cycle protein [Culicoidibacterales bacterium]